MLCPVSVFHFLNDQIMFHCMDMPRFVHPFVCSWVCIWVVLPFDFMNSAVTFMYKFVYGHVIILLGIPRSGIAE